MNKEFLAKKKDINELKINKADKADLSILENSIDDLKTKNNEQDERIATLEDKTDADTKDTAGVTRFSSTQQKLYLIGCPTDVLGDTLSYGSTYTYNGSYIENGKLYINGKKIAYDEDKVNKVDGKGLSTNDYTTAEKTKLSGIAEGANKTVVDSHPSYESTNPVQNKVITSMLDNYCTLTKHDGDVDTLLSELRNKQDQIDLNSSDIEALNNTKVDKKTISNIAGTGLEYADYIDSSGVRSIKINHKKGPVYETIGPDPTTHTPNYGESFKVGYAHYDKEGHIIMGSNATIKMPSVDSELNENSTNPVQNKVICNQIQLLADSHRTALDMINLNSSDIEALNNSKVDKVDGKGLISDSEIARLANVENYDDTQIKSDIALNRTALGMQCKNLIKPIYQTSTIQDVTFTINSNNSITVNGTNNLSTSDANFKIFDQQLERGTYTLTGGVSETFRLRLGTGPSNTFVGIDIGNGFTFTVSEKARYVILCQVPKSETANNITFYPMLRYADITDGTYEPYTDDLQTQIQNNNQKIEYITGISRKNLCNITYTSRKVNNVLNVTVNSDKTISLLTDSAVTVNVIEILTPLITLKANTTYILSGGISSIIRLELRDENKNPFIFDSGSGTEYTSRTNKNVYVAVRIQSGTEINPSVTLSPMLRIKGTDSTYEPYQDDLQTQINNILARLTAGGI